MDIREYLIARHDKETTLKLIRFIQNNPMHFKILIQFMLGNDSLLAQRASWPFSYLAIENPKWLNPYFQKLMNKLKEEGNHPAIRRNILRAFQEIEIPEKHQSELLDLTFKFSMSEAMPLAVRAFSITVASHICKPYPELKNELLIILKELGSIPQAPAIKVRIKSALKELKAVDSKI